MDRSLPDENPEWKSIRSELCGMLQVHLDGDEGSPTHHRQCGRGYVRMRIVTALPGETGGLLRLKHQEKVRRSHLGPFGDRELPHPAHAACECPGCTDRADRTDRTRCDDREDPSGPTSAREIAAVDCDSARRNGSERRTDDSRRPLRPLQP